MSSPIRHVTDHLELPSGQRFDQFRRRFETAVPECGPQQIPNLLTDQPSWEQVRVSTARMAPHAFLRYAALDPTPVFAVAKDTPAMTAYLMGNHVIAHSMARHDPRVMLHVPLRVLLVEDADGCARFHIDRPSAALRQLHHPVVTTIAVDLDAKVLTLLDALEVVVPAGTWTDIVAP